MGAAPKLGFGSALGSRGVSVILSREQEAHPWATASEIWRLDQHPRKMFLARNNSVDGFALPLGHLRIESDELGRCVLFGSSPELIAINSIADLGAGHRTARCPTCRSSTFLSDNCSLSETAALFLRNQFRTLISNYFVCLGNRQLAILNLL